MRLRTIALFATILSTAACSATPGDDHVPANRQANAIGIASYAFEAHDETLAVSLFDDEGVELGIVDMSSGLDTLDVFVSLADSPHTLDMHLRGQHSELLIDEQDATDHGLVLEHLQVVEALISDPVVRDELGTEVQWRKWPWDYVAYTACFYGAIAGGADAATAGQVCHDLYL
ncbi:MAG: hypothetical protein K0V04_08505 [Deltaproteobacteria bacterium]|nr:hypothetical protein [Deltaproteobacteria bacterium]